MLTLPVLACIVVPAAGDCAKEPGNLIAKANCGFGENVAGWTASEGAVLSHAMDGSQPVMKAVADTGGSLTVMSPCVKARAAAPYTFTARLRRTAGTVYFCSLNVWQFSDDQCSGGQEPLGSAGVPPEVNWATPTATATTAETTKSIQLRPACSGEPAFAIQLDDFVVTQR